MERIPLRMGILNLLHEILHAFGASHDPKGMLVLCTSTKIELELGLWVVAVNLVILCHFVPFNECWMNQYFLTFSLEEFSKFIRCNWPLSGTLTFEWKGYFHGLRTPNEAFFHRNPKLLGLDRQFGQTIWADKFRGIWGIFGWFISTHFGTVSPLSMFSINQPLFLQTPLYPNSKHLFGIGIWIWAAKN